MSLRLPELTEEEMTPEQRVVAAEMLSGARKRLHGPFHPWLRSPIMAQRLGQVGEYLRFTSVLPRDVLELAILHTAHRCTSSFEWRAHVPYALEAGVSQATIDAIADGAAAAPDGAPKAHAIVYDFCRQLMVSNRVDDRAYAETRALLGEQGLVELVALMAHYIGVALIISVAGGDDAPL